MHGRPLATIKHSKLDPRFVDSLPHQAAESVYLAYDLPFGYSSNCGIAAHLANGIEVSRQQRDPGTEPSGGCSCLSASMPSTYNNDIVFVLIHKFSELIGTDFCTGIAVE
jgi:hypothetical protein